MTALTALIPSDQIYRDSEQVDNQDVEAAEQTVVLPAIIISVETAQQAVVGIGVFGARVRLRAKTNQDDTLSDDTLAILKELRNAINIDDLPGELNTVAAETSQDFHCYGYSDQCGEDEEISGRSRANYIDVNLAVSAYAMA